MDLIINKALDLACFYYCPFHIAEFVPGKEKKVLLKSVIRIYKLISEEKKKIILSVYFTVFCAQKGKLDFAKI